MSTESLVGVIKEMEGNLKNQVGELKQENQKQLDEMRNQIDGILKKNGRFAAVQKETSGGLGGDVMKSLDDSQVNSDLTAFCEGRKKSFSFEVKDMSIGSNYTGGSSLNLTSPVGVVGSTSYFSHVRDILPKIPMSTGSIPVIRDNGKTGGFETVAEGLLKPTIEFSLAESPAKAEVIAAVTVITRQFLDDLGPQGVSNWMAGRLTELYLQAEDAQLLNGDGVSPNLKGVNTTGNFTAATSLAADNNIVQLVTSIVQLRTLGRAAKAIIINPGNLASLLLNVASGSGEFDLPAYVSVNAAGGISILGVPVIDTPGQTLGTFSVLDSSQMLMGIRENFGIRFFEQDEDNVKKNKITVRAESRIAFAVYNNSGNVKGTF